MHTKVLALEHAAPPSLSRYGIALLSVTLAAVLTLALHHWGYSGIFALFYCAVAASVWLGGLFPALVATGLSASIILFISQPFFTFSAPGPYHLSRLLLFVLVSLIICGLGVARARSDAAHRASEQHYRLLFDRNLAGVFLSTLDGQMLDCNESFARILGYDSRKEVLSHPALDFYFDNAHRESYIERLQEVGSVSTFEVRVRGKDDRPIWTIENVSLIEDDLGGRTLLQGTILDFTERKRAEEALREATRKYRDIFENAVEGIFRTTPDGRFIEANPALASMIGFDSPADLLKDQSDFARQAYVEPQRREEFKQLMGEHGMVRDFEFEVRRKDGSKIWISEHVRAVHDDNGKLLYYEGTAEDITERKQTEAALREREARLSAIYSAAPVGIGVDVNRVIQEVNDTMCNITGYSREELIGQNSRFLYLTQEDYERVGREKYYAIAERLPKSIVTRSKRKDGCIIDVLLSAVPLDAEDLSQGVTFTVLDITERKKIEEALRESEERYRDLVENSREFICTHDLDGLILSANRAASDVLGYELSDYCGKMNFRDLLVPEVRDQFDDYLARIRRDGIASGLTLVQTSSGERRILEYYNTVRTEGVATPIVRGMARDITERKEAGKALRESEERFRQLSEAAFEAIVIHDNGTILEVNQSFCRMYGYERGEVIGKSVLDLTPPEFRELLMQRVRAGSASSYEGLALRKDGTIFRAELAAKSIHYQGRAVRVAAIRDITEQKRNERRQAAQYAVTRVLAESATLAEATPQLLQVICKSLRWKMGEFWRVCDSRNLLRCVDTWHVPSLDATSFIEASRQIELAPGAGLPSRVWQSGQPEWIPDVMTDPRFARAAIAAKIGLRGAVAFPILLGTHTLGVMLFFSRTAPEVDEDLLKLLSAIGSQIGQFIERKQIEEALRESEERYRELFENARDAIYVHDLSGKYISVNRAAEKLSGFPRTEIIGKNIAEIVAPKHLKKIRARLREKLSGREQTAYEIEIIAKDGHRVHVEIDSRLIYENGIAVAVQGMARDISDRRWAEEALRTFPRRLIGAQEAERRRVARELHDEIGQALTAIRINLQSVQQPANGGELTSQLDGSLKIIDRALQQVRDLALDLRPSLLDDLGLVAALRWYLDREATRAGLILELDIDLHGTRLAAEIETACFRIAQEALTNIVRHARAKRVSVELALRDADLRLVIRDDGVGFDVGAAQHRFAAGASLGLQGMQERAIAVGGKLEIESSEEKGTEVRVQLPFLPNLSSHEED